MKAQPNTPYDKRVFYLKTFLLLLTTICIHSVISAQKPRARDIGIPFEGTPGKYNAITDVKGVEVGYSTIISGRRKKHSW